MSTFTIHRLPETVGEEGSGCIDFEEASLFHIKFYYCTELIHFMILFSHVGEEEGGSV